MIKLRDDRAKLETLNFISWFVPDLRFATKSLKVLRRVHEKRNGKRGEIEIWYDEFQSISVIALRSATNLNARHSMPEIIIKEKLLIVKKNNFKKFN